MNERIIKLQEMLRKDGTDGAVYATSGHLQYFLDDCSFFWRRTTDTGGGRQKDPSKPEGHALNKADCILYVPADDEPVLFTTLERNGEIKAEGIKKVICSFYRLADEMELHIRGSVIACGESCEAHLKELLAEVDPLIRVTEGERYGDILRSVKDAGEIARLRAAAKFTDDAMALVADNLKPGITPREVENLIVKIALDNDLRDIAFPPAAIFVKEGAPGSETLFNFPKGEPLSEGTSIGFDFGYLLDGYCSDYGRSFYCGKNPSVSDAYKALMEAQLYLFDRLKPGFAMNSSFEILHKKLEERGLGKYLRKAGEFYIMGHQIGINVHERPWLRSDENSVLIPGMVMCVEPKIMWPGKCYLRAEDMVLITENGCEPLTVFDRNKFELYGG